MYNIKWDYVSPLKKGTEIDVVEIKYHFALPTDLKICLKENNAGVPSLSIFDMANEQGLVFGGLLSFNEDDVDNIYDFIGLFENKEKNELKMFPFGIDPSGNFYCVYDNKIVFYDHESDRSKVICDTFTEFIAMLHD